MFLEHGITPRRAGAGQSSTVSTSERHRQRQVRPARRSQATPGWRRAGGTGAVDVVLAVADR